MGGGEWWWWLDFVEQPQTGCGWGMGAEDQSFLLKCNKSIRERVGAARALGTLLSRPLEAAP